MCNECKKKDKIIEDLRKQLLKAYASHRIRCEGPFSIADGFTRECRNDAIKSVDGRNNLCLFCAEMYEHKVPFMNQLTEMMIRGEL